jgi:hypothetical protein
MIKARRPDPNEKGKALVSRKRIANQRRYADILIHIMFGAFTVMWVEACSEKIASFKEMDIIGYTLTNFYDHPRFFLCVLTFFSLVCLWWWYTNILFKDPIFDAVGISAWDLLLLSSFALCYNSWGREYKVFGIIFLLSLVLLVLRFKISLMILEGKDDKKRPSNRFFKRALQITSGLTGFDTKIFDRPHANIPEYQALLRGYRWLQFILLVLSIVLAAGRLNSEDGTFKAAFVQWTLVALVGACIAGTVAAYWRLIAAQNSNDA